MPSPTRSLAAALAALSTAAAVHAQYQEPHILYTDASALPGGDGSDWLHAFRDLQDALAAVPTSAATNGDHYEIHIAQGIYRPDRGTHDRNASFVVNSAVSLAGGFGGLLSPNPDQLDPNVFVSVLSGDLLNDDGPNFTNTSDNSRHVVRMFGNELYIPDPNTPPIYRLRNLTIRAGNAVDDSLAEGAGVLFSSWNDDLYIYNCIFRDSHAGNGAAIAYENSAKCSFDSCVFQSNLADGLGGAIYTPYVSALNLTNSSLSSNLAGGLGGAVFSNNASISSCIVSANSASEGAGLYLYGRGVIANSRIVANVASYRGAGATVASYSFLSCLIAHNSAEVAAGISATGAADISNCTFVRNTASQSAAAVLVGSYPAASARIWNSIIWNNPAPTGKSIVAGSYPLSVDHCLVQNGLSAISASPLGPIPGLITADPHFVDPIGTSSAPAAWADKDYRLTSASPAIDAGLDASVALRQLGVDLAGATRLNNSTCAAYARPDLGAYEFTGYICPSPIATTYVRAAAAPGGDGRSWATAFLDLRDALAVPGVRDIWIAEGVYTADRGTGDRDSRFWIEKQYVSLYGSFAGTETSPSQRSIAAHPTILSADLLHNDSPAGGSVTSTIDNASGIMYVEVGGSISLSGLKFTGTHAVASDNADYASALRLFAGSAAISDCTFVDNHVAETGTGQSFTGGALNTYTENSLTLQRCSFTNNSTNNYGGAINAWSLAFSASDCTFVGNTAANAGAAMVVGGPASLLRCSFLSNAAIGVGNATGGALFLNSNGANITSCRFSGNLAFAYPDPTATYPAVHGGALCCGFNSVPPIVANSLFAGNRCAGTNPFGAAMYCENAALANCTFADNAAATTLTGPGTAPAVFAGSYSGSAANCIFWNSTAFGAGPQSSFGAVNYGAPQTFNCIVQGGSQSSAATSVLDLDPRFTNPAGPDGIIGTADDDYSLRPDSPAIDAADSSRLPAGITTDLAGNPRFFDAPGVPNTGLGTPNYLDIGAYEFSGPHPCLADFNNSGAVNSQDIFDFLTAWFSGSPSADINGNGLTPSDILDFITAWFAGC
jgi:predicted outer membrane repeat protein